MKIVGEYLADGKVIVIPETSDDLYYIYNTIAPGDRIQAKTSRKMKRTDSGMDGERITVFMEITVEEIEFHGFGETIRIRGIINQASDESISLGSHHAITIELYKKLTIIKDNWTQGELNRLRDAQMGDPKPLVVVSMDDQSAIISQVGSHASKILLELDPAIPRKGSDPSQHQQATREFFKELSAFLEMKREEGIAEYIVVGGPGFTKDNFFEYVKINHPDLLTNFQVVASDSAGRPGIREIITHRLPDNFIAGKTASFQAKLIEEILEILGKDYQTIAYGSDVPRALEMGAVDRLVILDSLMHDTIEQREKIEELMEKNEQMGGKSILFSSMHDSSEIIKGLGGIVALLRFELPK